MKRYYRVCAAPARVAMSIIIFLVISNKVDRVTESLPKSGQSILLIDFCIVSFAFAFFAVAEYGVYPHPHPHPQRRSTT